MSKKKIEKKVEKKSKMPLPKKKPELAKKVMAKAVKSAAPEKKKELAKPAQLAKGAKKETAKKVVEPAGKGLKTKSVGAEKAKIIDKKHTKEAPAANKAAPVAAKVAHPAAKDKKAAPVAVATKGKKEVLVEVSVKVKKEILVEVESSVAKLISKDDKKKAKAAQKEQAIALANKKRCREPGCENEIVVNRYCRLHYIKNWKKTKRKEAILASGQLNNYVEELVSKYPDKYLEVIRQDLATEKDWSKVVTDLELDAGDDDIVVDDEADGPVETVRASRTEFDEDGDAF